jgi:hypothetical protein
VGCAQASGLRANALRLRDVFSGVRHLVDSNPPTKRASTHYKAAKTSGDSEPSEAADRPTVIPPFDLASYARESMPPSFLNPMDEANAEAARDSEEMPTMVPARGPSEMPDESPTVIPPPDAFASREAFRSEMPTFTDENQLERARRASILAMSSAPPASMGAVAPTADTTGNVSHAPSAISSVVSALSLADMRMPTPPPIGAVVAVGAARAVSASEFDVVSSSASKARAVIADESRDAPLASQLNPVVDMRDRFSLGDYSGALGVADAILTKDASNVEAAKMAEECQRVLIKMYAARIGPLDRVPMVMVQPHELRWLSIDHRAGFLLSLVDGVSSIEMILDVSGMPLLDTLRILHELYQQRVISFRA